MYLRMRDSDSLCGTGLDDDSPPTNMEDDAAIVFAEAVN